MTEDKTKPDDDNNEDNKMMMRLTTSPTRQMEDLAKRQLKIKTDGSHHLDHYTCCTCHARGALEDNLNNCPNALGIT